jgi:hypothetical protein
VLFLSECAGKLPVHFFVAKAPHDAFQTTGISSRYAGERDVPISLELFSKFRYFRVLL